MENKMESMKKKEEEMKRMIGEKGWVGGEMGGMVGGRKREEGYLEGGGYGVRWGLGEVVEVGMGEG